MESLNRALQASNQWFPDQSLEALLVSLLTAFVLGQVVAWVYSWSHTGVSYSRTFTQSLLLMAMVVTMVMFVIGNSIITAFGLIGALAIIRFRNVLKDTRDTVFVFFVLVLGLAAGTQRYLLAIVGTAAFCSLALYLFHSSFGTLGRYDGHLMLRLAAAADEAELFRSLRELCRSVKHISRRRTGVDTAADYVLQVRLKDRHRGDDLVEALRTRRDVTDVSLVLRDEMSEI